MPLTIAASVFFPSTSAYLCMHTHTDIAMASRRMDSEEEALFRSYPYALYFVQSPPTPISHGNSNAHNYYDHDSPGRPSQGEATLFRYSSSHGSNNWCLQETKKKYAHEDGGTEITKSGVDHHVDGGHGEDEDDDYDDYGHEERKKGWVKYLSFSYSNSGWWILVQLSWRFLLSLMIALVVFYVAAKPPPPSVSVKVASIRQFRLGEGVDASGVATKILSCNCSIEVVIDNKSKLFDLHVRPPFMEMLFGQFPFAMSQGKEVYADSDDSTTLMLSVETENKAMYGAGRNMQDLLGSGKGLPLVIRVTLRSSFQVVWGIFEPKFYHEAQCLVVLHDKYDKKHKTQEYNSTCVITF